MTTSGTITMTMREVDRLRTMQPVVDGMLMTWQAQQNYPTFAVGRCWLSAGIWQGRSSHTRTDERSNHN
ncbi:hypothetical protein [Paraburkholderia sp. GAS334]|uniref:hypothetical protein n=1 Tax=Paraburkholderia sp. GAS334 TaxID=3035131 RepID=UPI003D242980